MDIFKTVKGAVTARDAAVFYGIKVSGNGMCRCPFHNDRTPSMKVDRRYHCFGCGADGDVIDLVAGLFSLSMQEAAVKLAEDMGITAGTESTPGRDNKDPPDPIKIIARALAERAARAEIKCFDIYSNYLGELRKWQEEYAPKTPDEEWHPLFAEALQKIPEIEYLLDTLLYGDPEDKIAVITDQGKEVREIERRIQNSGGSQRIA